MTKFKSPARRLTRQRSGHKVSGITTGGECKLRQSESVTVSANTLRLTFKAQQVQLSPSFDRNLAFVAFSGYLFPSENIRLRCDLQYRESRKAVEDSHLERFISSGRWSKFGLHCIFDMKKSETGVGELHSSMLIESKHSMGKIDFFGFDLNAVHYYRDKDLWDRFDQKTSIYLPEIYYFDLDEAFSVRPKEYNDIGFSKGRCVVLKSCNRCARFLLVDIENERNAISFSNHCLSQAPCTHALFSRYKVIENQCDRLPQAILTKRISVDKSQHTLLKDKDTISGIETYYGYQLECRPCKKYYVNAPLNPMRDSTQHREDSLRRRALEVLVDELLGREWIYHKWRVVHKKEFDVHIWERFDKKCFNCGRSLRSPKDMDLDHTMPLAFLWPLDDDATCLCKTCNSQKRDRFPINFYAEDKLGRLSEITGLSGELVRSRRMNMEALNKLKEKIVWFFDDFLMMRDYQKVRVGKRTSDLIYKAIEAAIQASGLDLDLVAEYVRIANRFPRSISADR